MARPIAPIKSAFCFLLLLMLVPARMCLAQGFELRGESSLTGTFTLTLYDGDSTSHYYTAKANKGLFLFTGRVEHPLLASLQHAAMAQPLYFYIENAAISVSLNATHPEATHIKGSRSNSEYRYLMERYHAATDPAAFLRQYVKENSQSIYLPFILYQQQSVLDDALVRQLVRQVEGKAQHTYHYNLLCRQLRQTPTVAEGGEMPDFAYLDSNRIRRTFADNRNPDGYTLLFIGASWCDICKRQLQQAETLLQKQNIQILPIRIDDNPKGWDAHYLQQLSVDHLPYMILVDPDGIVAARDIRLWELSKLKAKK